MPGDQRRLSRVRHSVTGGNVSLYNQNPGGAIDPTPTIGMVGLLNDVTKAVPSHFSHPGDAVLLLGATRGHLGGSAYWAEVLDCVGGPPPPIDLVAERALQETLIEAADRRRLRSAHDLSDGGLAVALAECCIGGPWAMTTHGVDVDLSRHAEQVSDEGWLFGEDGARAIVSCPPEHVAEIQRLSHDRGVQCHYLGLVGERGAPIRLRRDDRRFEWDGNALRKVFFDAIPRRMRGPTVTEGS